MLKLIIALCAGVAGSLSAHPHLAQNAISSFAQDTENGDLTSDSETVTDVEDEILSLEKKLHAKRRQAATAELKAQPYLLEDWDEYLKLIKESEQLEAEAAEIEAKLKLLMQERAAMIKEGKE